MPRVWWARLSAGEFLRQRPATACPPLTHLALGQAHLTELQQQGSLSTRHLLAYPPSLHLPWGPEGAAENQCGKTSHRHLETQGVESGDNVVGCQDLPTSESHLSVTLRTEGC